MKLFRWIPIVIVLAVPGAVRAGGFCGGPAAGPSAPPGSGSSAAAGVGLSAESVSPLFAEPRLATESRLLAGIGGVSHPGDRKKKPAEPKTEETGGTSAKKAMLYSLLVPGLGQQISGHPERARVFYGVEAAIWTSFVVFRLQGNARRDRYIEFAQYKAGIDPAGKNDDYWRLVSIFERSDPGPGSANEFVRRQARAIYPMDRAAQDAWYQAHGYFGDNAWDWQNSDNLSRFRDLRNASLNSYQDSKFSIGFAIAHRIISMIDAARVAGSGKRTVSPPAGGQGQSGSNRLERHGRFGMKLVRDGGARVPMVTYKLTF